VHIDGGVELLNHARGYEVAEGDDHRNAKAMAVGTDRHIPGLDSFVRNLMHFDAVRSGGCGQRL
jgi:hypothetical protein